MKDPRYATLLRILDGIRSQAPSTIDFKRFRSRKPEDVVFSRGQAFIHLFLLIKFGLESFDERQKLISDGPNDGGLDAHFISEAERTVYLVQSKFRSSGSNFIEESISAADLVRMELDRILRGESTDSNGAVYNPKVLEFQVNYNQATRKQIFENKVIFLANLKNFNEFQIRKLTANLDFEVYDFERSYLELVKPMCSATYYRAEKIVIDLDLSEKSTPQLSQTISTSYGNCDITVVFVPTREIGRVMSKYKNAILRYNPRNYLGLGNNPVNKEIRKSISSKTHNDFALLNNGITILADEQALTVFTGTKNVGRLTLTNPQIINGGQTAHTLSDLYEKDLATNPTIFDGKEVLTRVVVLKPQSSNSPADRHGFTDTISTATNRQTLVKAADRHSSNPVLVDIQEEVFRRYGYLVELKQGEFYSGKEKGYVTKEYIIDRIVVLRSVMAFSGLPTPARRHSESQLFQDSFFQKTFASDGTALVDQLSAEIFFSYKVHTFLTALEKKEGKKSLTYGYSLRYGKYAVVCASAITMDKSFRTDLTSRSLADIEQYIDGRIPQLLDTWRDFEDKVQNKKENLGYFDPNTNLLDWDTYYKGTTLKSDLVAYFTNKA